VLVDGILPCLFYSMVYFQRNCARNYCDHLARRLARLQQLMRPPQYLCRFGCGAAAARGRTVRPAGGRMQHRCYFVVDARAKSIQTT